MNQNFDDSSKLSSGSVLVKEFEIVKDVGDMLESWLNKAKEVEDVRNNITIVKPSSGTSDSKKIMISNLNPEKIKNIETTIAKVTVSSGSSDSESDEDNLN